MDMARPYIQAVKETLPDLPIVFDRFHIMKYVNEAVDTVRKKLNESLDKEEKRGLKRSRFLLLRNEGSLTLGEQQRLNYLLGHHEPLMIMHMMKEELRRLWQSTSRKHAEKFLLNWCLDALSTVSDYDRTWGPQLLKPLKKLAFFIARNREGILAYFDHRITNGRAEGVNNKIKTLKRSSYGFRDMEYFKLRLYHLHRQKRQLAG